MDALSDVEVKQLEAKANATPVPQRCALATGRELLS